eukprot:CAMPEP_0174710718 /NCGR_PEP_ID=MMETSP1094-20130205/12257_1 /TAXON_ID=156173 /ORGANISM="Chrysochromulina brevifilum, Strain UTEX LB 985" /LENGTH=142 /DNA_ID=CAMNT_0015909551 /DNA_START=62 /DNA_END=490 /DNA_ORIENTATION=-
MADEAFEVSSSSDEDEDDVSEQAPLEQVMAPAKVKARDDEDDDLPCWLVDAANDVGLNETTPTGEGAKKKPSLRKVLAALKDDSSKSTTARRVKFDEASELESAHEEIETLRRANQLQAQYIKTLKQRYDVLEQRLLLRESS